MARYTAGENASNDFFLELVGILQEQTPIMVDMIQDRYMGVTAKHPHYIPSIGEVVALIDHFQAEIDIATERALKDYHNRPYTGDPDAPWAPQKRGEPRYAYLQRKYAHRIKVEYKSTEGMALRNYYRAKAGHEPPNYPHGYFYFEPSAIDIAVQWDQENKRESAPRPPFRPFPKLWEAFVDEPDLLDPQKNLLTFAQLFDASRALATRGKDAARTILDPGR